MSQDSKPWQFQPGGKGGPGRPPKRKEEKYLEILLEVVTEDDFRAVITRMVKDAIRGWKSARRDLLEYVLGKPTQMVDVQLTDTPMMRLIQKWREEDRAANAEPGAET